MNGLKEMRGFDFFRGSEIGDRAGDLEDAVVGARGKAELLHRLLQQIAQGGVDRTVTADLSVSHPRVDRHFRAGEARLLAGAGGVGPDADCGGGLARPLGTKLGEGQGGGVNMDVDAVEERAADA